MGNKYNTLKLSQMKDGTWNIEYDFKLLKTKYISSGHKTEQEAIDEVNYMMKREGLLHTVEKDYKQIKHP